MALPLRSSLMQQLKSLACGRAWPCSVLNFNQVFAKRGTASQWRAIPCLFLCGVHFLRFTFCMPLHTTSASLTYAWVTLPCIVFKSPPLHRIQGSSSATADRRIGAKGWSEWAAGGNPGNSPARRPYIRTLESHWVRVAAGSAKRWTGWVLPSTLFLCLEMNSDEELRS